MQYLFLWRSWKEAQEQGYSSTTGGEHPPSTPPFTPLRTQCWENELLCICICGPPCPAKTRALGYFRGLYVVLHIYFSRVKAKRNQKQPVVLSVIHLLVWSAHKGLYLNSLFSGSVLPIPACVHLSSLTQSVLLWVIASLAKRIRALYLPSQQEDSSITSSCSRIS